MGTSTINAATLEALCGVLGDTDRGLTGSEIGALLGRCGINDVTPSITKRRRLYEALAARQARDGVANNVISLVEAAMHPARYVGNSRLFEERQASLNSVLALEGLRRRVLVPGGGSR